MSTPMILYHYPISSSSWRVRWALLHKRLAYQEVVVDLSQGSQWSEAHRERNPRAMVPTLEIDGRQLSESVAIFEYLEETRPLPPLYPPEPWPRARVRQVVELINSGIQPLQNLRVLEHHASQLGHADETASRAARKAWAQHFNRLGLEACERLLLQVDGELGRGRFAIGDTLSAADLFLVPQLSHARRFGVEVAAFPRLLAAEEAALATEHARAAAPVSDTAPRAP